MTADELAQNAGVEIKICRQQIQKQINLSKTKHIKESLNMKIGLIIKCSSIIMQSKRK